jgi:hypothetical protein
MVFAHLCIDGPALGNSRAVKSEIATRSNAVAHFGDGSDDEASFARRKYFGGMRYRPNRAPIA